MRKIDKKVEYLHSFEGDLIRVKNAIGFCHSTVHRGYITKKLLKEHDCLKKECMSFEKVECGLWAEMEKKEAEKAKEKLVIEKKREKREKARARFEDIREMGKEFGVFVTSIKDKTLYKNFKRKTNILHITYIAYERMDLKEMLAPKIFEKYGRGVYFKCVPTKHEIKKQLLG